MIIYYSLLLYPYPNIWEKHSGFHSRRINHSHRIIYTYKGNILTIISCRYHYE
ncbi:MAG: hypothetical protein HOG78_06085 [Rhodobacterales bacterium]|nr:hypothetical protein [Rhodobacterales bacterium]